MSVTQRHWIMAEHTNPYKWEERHSQLNDALTALVPFPQSIPYYVDKAHINPGAVAWLPVAYDVWHSVISLAIRENKVQDLVAAALSRHPNDPYLLTAAKAENIIYVLGPKPGVDIPWKGTDAAIAEVLTQPGLNTLMQINFLEKGIKKSKPVAKVQYKRGGRTASGSGFVTDDNIFITCHHVIPDAATASIATILFNYEDDADDIPKNAVPFRLDATSMVTSVEYDATAVRLLGDANHDYGTLPLVAPNTLVAKAQFVNIIQHPAGMPKKIALYHNIVTTAEDIIVQYLTDTLQGSSGSPVFNSDWEVVALHHSGGMAAEEVDIKNIVFQNEGINILRVMEMVEQAKRDNVL